MKRVGGIFFKAKDPKAGWTWYRDQLGIDVGEYGVAVFHWVDDAGKPLGGATAWRDASDELVFAGAQAQALVEGSGRPARDARRLAADLSPWRSVRDPERRAFARPLDCGDRWSGTSIRCSWLGR